MDTLSETDCLKNINVQNEIAFKMKGSFESEQMKAGTWQTEFPILLKRLNLAVWLKTLQLSMDFFLCYWNMISIFIKIGTFMLSPGNETQKPKFISLGEGF